MMKQVISKSLASLLVLACATGVLFSVAGCGSDKPDMSDAKERVQMVKDFNSIYKSVDGDWDKLTPDQKAAVIKLSEGSELKAHAGFVGTKYGATAAQRYIAEARARGEK